MGPSGPRGSTGPVGPAGPEGSQGPAGPSGSSIPVDIVTATGLLAFSGGVVVPNTVGQNIYGLADSGADIISNVGLNTKPVVRDTVLQDLAVLSELPLQANHLLRVALRINGLEVAAVLFNILSAPGPNSILTAPFGPLLVPAGSTYELRVEATASAAGVGSDYRLTATVGIVASL